MNIKIPSQPSANDLVEIHDGFEGSPPHSYGRDILWSIRTDAVDLVSFLRRKKNFSRRKAFILFCSIAWAAVKAVKDKRKRP